MKRGWTEARLEKLLGGNFLRALPRRLGRLNLSRCARPSPTISTHRACAAPTPKIAGLREIRIVERAERDGDQSVELGVELAVDLVMDVGSAVGAEMEGDRGCRCRAMLTPARSSRPSIVTCSAGQRACAANALPERFWQSRQWQTDTRTGLAVSVARSWPQRQEAVRVGHFAAFFERQPDERVERRFRRRARPARH